MASMASNTRDIIVRVPELTAAVVYRAGHLAIFEALVTAPVTLLSLYLRSITPPLEQEGLLLSAQVYMRAHAPSSWAALAGKPPSPISLKVSFTPRPF
ncbi:hypothetical protein QBC46DRAFT_342778 [Diplogelasinospora grovesii]|uniref:Uncharacterized protein n=1 Tax=Diplogelasinospora grovesii TaxID=303347 RepID=A0AAN6N6M9_9PEZI|nr:hypothetical protein QBC46DRAFT_342778 [Diplogelasinospora grovesii]